MFRRLLLFITAILITFFAVGCASSINTVYKAESLGKDDPYTKITVNGVSTTITHVYFQQPDGRITRDRIVPKDSPTMEAVKVVYNFTPWGLLTRAFNPTSMGVYRLHPGKVILQVFSRRKMPLIRKDTGDALDVFFGWYSFIAVTLDADESYEIDAAERLGTTPGLSPRGQDLLVLTGPDVSALLAAQPAEKDGGAK